MERKTFLGRFSLEEDNRQKQCTQIKNRKQVAILKNLVTSTVTKKTYNIFNKLVC